MDVQEKTGKFTGKAAGSVLLTLAAALALWLFIAANHRKAALEDISKSLETINSYKTAEISAWLDEHRREALRLSRHPFLCEIISAELSNPGSRRSTLAAWLKDHTEQKLYSAMAFLSPKGAVIAATPDYLPEIEEKSLKAFEQASQKGTPLVTDLHLASDGTPHIVIFSPISTGGRGGKPLCVLVVQINPEDVFYPILKAAPLFFARAETLLVRKEGENALFLNPLDHAKDSALKFTRPLSDERLPAAAALRGVTGFFPGVDYRGVKVFSAIGPVPGTNWAVITKVDRDTVIAPAKSREHSYLATILLGAALLYFMGYVIIRARHHAAEAALAKSRHLLAETEKIGKVGGWEFDIATNELLCTEEVARIHELEPGYKFDIKKDTRFYTPGSRPLIEQAIRRSIETGENFDLELEIITAKGNTRAVHTIGKPDPANRRIRGFFQDITERKRAERERLAHLQLLESMDRVNRAIQGAGDLEKMMSEVLKAALKIFDCDRAWLFYPCDPDAPSFRVPMEITKPEYPGAGILNVDIPMPPDMTRDLREVLESAEPVTYTVGTDKPVNKASAEQFGVKSQMVAALYPKSGKPWVFGIHQCSCPRVWTPEEMRLMKEIGWRLTDSLTSLSSHRDLQESEHSLKEAQQIANLGSYSFDIAGGTWKSSPELDRIFGIANGNYSKDLEGWAEIVHPDERDAMQAYVMDHVVAEKQNFDRQYRIVRISDRAERWVHGRGEVSTNAAGNAVTLKGVIQDITEVKQAELELKRLNRDLIAKRQEMENFLYITSHDLRTPLVNIQGFAQNLERYLSELRKELAPALLTQPVSEAVSKLADKEIPGALKFVLESSRKMDSLISSLLKVARLGRVEMKTHALEMNDLVKKIVDATRYQLEEAGASAKVGILPPCKADPTAVSQIFANLLENAIKYRAGDRPLAVSITGEARGDSVLYKVADNGSGIAARDLGRIWDIFYRGSSARGGEGEGIGLTVVKYMAEKNGGSIKAESEEGSGTVFYLELPAAGGTK